MRAFLEKIGPQDRVLVIGDTRQHQGAPRMLTHTSHLHAIHPALYVGTEPATLNTFTPPFGLTCKRCSYVLALVADQIHVMQDSETKQAFSRQVQALQIALDNDHHTGHRQSRFLTDGEHTVAVPTNRP